ncbi:hypothetical protein [Kineococcus arenarius]|uniref:hypothetical protein n=1 Tax=unclassified Kineococcus TaxID=2621656 RepID=UPI003D7CBA0C
MAEPDDRDVQRQRGPDPMPFTSGNQFAPFQREHDPQAGPQRTWMIVAGALGPLLIIAVLLWVWVR